MPRLRAVLLLALVLATPRFLAGQPDAAPAGPPVHYQLDARLDPVNRLVIGTGRLTWRNPSTQPAAELRFQMAWNAWRDARSSWMRDRRLAGAAEAVDPPDADAGFIDLTSLSLTGQDASLLADARFVAPDDGNGGDRTVLAVPLPAPVAPGGTVDLTFAWNAHVPRPFDRTGVIDRTFFLASWFPQIGVFDDEGWHSHQVRAGARPYNEFGRYDVTLTVPAGWPIGASGIEASASATGPDVTTHRYTAADVQDFAWTTSPDYVERTDRIVRADGTAVALRLLLQPEHVEQDDRQFAAVRAAVQVYERRIGRLPWPQLTIVDPAVMLDPAAPGSGLDATAYPMLIVGRTRWLTPWASPVPEATLANQVGRLFFAVDAAPDGIAHPWLDDGIAALALGQVMPEAFPQRFVKTERYFSGLVAWPYTDVAWRPDVSAPGARWLSTLAASIGPDATMRVLADYAARARLGHPSPATFLDAVRAAAGPDGDAGWFADGIAGLDADDDVDYAVTAVVSSPTGTGSIDTTVSISRSGRAAIPVDVRVSFADGSDVVERWDGRERTRVLGYRRGAPAVAVEIDPDRILAIDRHRTNNSWVAHPSGPRAADKWSLRWLAWFQQTLMTYAFFV